MGISIDKIKIPERNIKEENICADKHSTAFD